MPTGFKDDFQQPELPRLLGQIEFSGVREKALKVKIGSEQISAFLAEREAFYEDERTTGTKEVNQDCILVSQPKDTWHAGIADGVGGLPGGEVAARQALRFVHHSLFKQLGNARMQHIQESELRAALESVLCKASIHINQVLSKQTKPGGTTLVGAFPLSRERVLVYSVGDSGAALVPRNPLKPILYSLNHSGFERLIQAGRASRKEALTGDIPHLSTNLSGDVLTSALGAGEPGPRELFVTILDVKPGDQLFLFTDGLFKTVGRFSGRGKSRSEDLRRVEYGRADRLLQFLALPSVQLPIIADRHFRSHHDGPDQLADDVAVLRIKLRCDEEEEWLSEDHRIMRPRSRTMTALVDPSSPYPPVWDDDTLSITVEP